MTQFYTYLHCKPNGSPFYVGKGMGRRSHDFVSGRNKHHKNTVAKHGVKNIGVFVFHCDSEQQAFSDEIQQIAQLRRDGYELANWSDGGEGPSGISPSVETRAKMSFASKGRNHSTEACKKISESRKGNTYNRGRKHSVEIREKMSVAMKGKKKSPEHCAKMSASMKGNIPWNKGIPMSEECKKRLSASRQGKKSSVETRAKMSANNKSGTPEVRAKLSKSRQGKKPTLGHTLSESHKAKLSAALKGNKHRLGQKATTETRAKMSASRLGNQNAKRS